MEEGPVAPEVTWEEIIVWNGIFAPETTLNDNAELVLDLKPETLLKRNENINSDEKLVEIKIDHDESPQSDE